MGERKVKTWDESFVFSRFASLFLSHRGSRVIIVVVIIITTIIIIVVVVIKEKKEPTCIFMELARMPRWRRKTWGTLHGWAILGCAVGILIHLSASLVGRLFFGLTFTWSVSQWINRSISQSKRALFLNQIKWNDLIFSTGRSLTGFGSTVLPSRMIWQPVSRFGTIVRLKGKAFKSPDYANWWLSHAQINTLMPGHKGVD